MASLNYDEAAHLLRRAGFGGTPDEIDSLTTKGREGAVPSRGGTLARVVEASPFCACYIE